MKREKKLKKGDKTLKMGDEFIYDKETYKVTKIPTFSTVVGENVDPKSGGAFMVKVPVREIELP
jgi:hypothetical protein